jgi:hypothetical protein
MNNRSAARLEMALLGDRDETGQATQVHGRQLGTA